MAHDRAGTIKEFAFQFLQRQLVTEQFVALDGCQLPGQARRGVSPDRSQRGRKDHADEGRRQGAAAFAGAG